MHEYDWVPMYVMAETCMTYLKQVGIWDALQVGTMHD